MPTNLLLSGLVHRVNFQKGQVPSLTPIESPCAGVWWGAGHVRKAHENGFEALLPPRGHMLLSGPAMYRGLCAVKRLCSSRYNISYMRGGR